jgi:hypothetical protein
MSVPNRNGFRSKLFVQGPAFRPTAASHKFTTKGSKILHDLIAVVFEIIWGVLGRHRLCPRHLQAAAGVVARGVDDYVILFGSAQLIDQLEVVPDNVTAVS